jgi:CheY-like chemotaxis protein
MTESDPASRPTVVLLVEDEPLVRMLGVDVLEDAGFTVVEAANASEALRALETRTDVRVLFTDVNMPGELDGLELARVVHQRWPDIRLLIASGQVSQRPKSCPTAASSCPSHGSRAPWCGASRR